MANLRSNSSKGKFPLTDHYCKIENCDILRILQLDGKLYTSNVCELSKFVTDNLLSYTVATNTWLYILAEMCSDPLPEVRHALLTQGLVGLIKLAADTADGLIKGNVITSCFTPFVRQLSFDQNADGLRLCLEGLRYLKRFSPKHTYSLIDQSVTDFVSRNNRAKLYNRRTLPRWIETGLSDILSDILQSINIEPTTCLFDIPTLSLDTQYRLSVGAIPVGATADSGKTIVEKLLKIEQYYPMFIPITANRYYDTNLEFPTGKLGRGFSKIVTVPKSYKARRVIAEEEVDRQTLMHPLARALDNCISSSCGKYGTSGFVTLHDQTRNQEMARIGSIDGSLATVDLSAASDSVTCSLVRTVFPDSLVVELDKWRSNYVILPSGKRIVSHLYTTMGSRVTFPIETMLFWAIACLAVEVSALFVGVEFSKSDISVYGDDIIVPTYSVDTLYHILEQCGFVVNEDKSFVSGNYRESCGEEYLYGKNISSHYYPRSSITNDNLGLLRLVQLQHKFCGFRQANAYLTIAIRELCPQMTVSHIGSPYNDIWSDYEQPLLADAPHNKKGISRSDLIHVQGTREYHITVKSSYKSSQNPVWIDAAERLSYYQFLLIGPKYDTPLDELLKVSARPVARAAMTSTSGIKLEVIKY